MSAPDGEATEDKASKPTGRARGALVFWRCALAATLAGAALGIFHRTESNIGQPGALPLLMLIGALLATGPPRQARGSQTFLQRAGSVLVVAGLAWPFVAALGLTEEKEAALLTMPVWSLVCGFVLLGWVLRQRVRAFDLLALGAMAAYRLLAPEAGSWNGELVWWAVSLLWAGGVAMVWGRLKAPRGDTPLIIAGIGWFVLLVAALTAQEFVEQESRFGATDDTAALAAIAQQPLAGYGSGSFTEVMLQYVRRPPVVYTAAMEAGAAPHDASFATRSALRLVTEIGIPATGALVVGALFLLGPSLMRRPWTRRRAVGAGLFGFWAGALGSASVAWFLPLMLCAFTAPLAMGRPEPDAETEPGDERQYAMQPWIAALVVLLVPAAVFPLAHRQWRAAQPEQNLAAESFLQHWTLPLRERAWHIRDRSGEIMQYADPRRELEPVVAQWIEAAPRDEWALVERVRLEEKLGGPEAAERAAREAARTLPWSPTFPLWAARAMTEQGRMRDAIAYLEEVVAEQAPAHPAVRNRLKALKLEYYSETRG